MTLASAVQQVVSSISRRFCLNKEQAIAYNIIASHFIRSHILPSQSASTQSTMPLPSSTPLRMLMTGPGGTGKSHVINAFKDLLSFFSMGHTLRLLAPTGSAAGLIDGMTVHKSLGLTVHSNSK
ncbi:hypothetical protein GGG16DRAFT_66191, partial [Schizophyllum commune]